MSTLQRVPLHLVEQDLLTPVELADLIEWASANRERLCCLAWGERRQDAGYRSSMSLRGEGEDSPVLTMLEQRVPDRVPNWLAPLEINPFAMRGLEIVY